MRGPHLLIEPVHFLHELGEQAERRKRSTEILLNG